MKSSSQMFTLDKQNEARPVINDTCPISRRSVIVVYKMIIILNKDIDFRICCHRTSQQVNQDDIEDCTRDHEFIHFTILTRFN